MNATTITFSFNLATGEGSVVGGGWDIAYQGHGDALSAWSAANADGFCLAPGASFGLHLAPTPVVR
jgi:hypothetical protein